MGGSERFCIICGGPLINFDQDKLLDYFYQMYTCECEIDRCDCDIDEKVEKIVDNVPLEKYSWLNELYLITDGCEKITTTSEFYDEDYRTFDVNGRNIVISSMTFYKGDKRQDYTRAVVCHQSCYDFIDNEFNYQLGYADIEPYLDVGDQLIKDHYNFYFEMAGYIGQMNNADLIYDKEPWLIDIDNERNRLRIKSAWYSVIYKIKFMSTKQNIIVENCNLSIIGSTQFV